jgi:transcriptional regulator with XRE-family HTH domain
MKPTELISAIKALHWTQAELARRTGISAQSVNAWATGSTPVPPWLPAYLGALLALRDAAISCGACKG